MKEHLDTKAGAEARNGGGAASETVVPFVGGPVAAAPAERDVTANGRRRQTLASAFVSSPR
ncbi:hypothetical protein AB0F25_39360 [Streptomyces wedmorensis]|uniref:Uncharacterized protein n=1 Tax=Streptomyces wedmorensis TaxID=43759 RepID=A0ABW6IME9_STRWE